MGIPIPMLVMFLLLAGVHAQSPASSPGPSSYIGPASYFGPASSLGLASSLGPTSYLGPSSAPTDCTTELLGLSECLSYVSEGSNTTVPDKGCCPKLSGLVDNAPQCLCPLLGSGEVLGFPIDKKKSLELPTVCHFSTTPISLCSLFGVPVSSPSLAPSSGGVPSSGGAPSGGLELPIFGAPVSSPSLAPSSGGGPSSGGAPSGGLELPTSSTPGLAPSSNRGSRGFGACNVFFFVALFFTVVSLTIF